jgi:hypothetical protein
MNHLETAVAGFDDVSIRNQPRRLDGPAATGIEVVPGERNGLDHEFRKLDAGPAEGRNVLLAPPRKAQASRTGPAQILGFGWMNQKLGVGELWMRADVIDMSVRGEDDPRPRGQLAQNGTQRSDAHSAVDKDVTFRAADQKAVRPDHPVTARLCDPKEIRPKLNHFEPGGLNR